MISVWETVVRNLGIVNFKGVDGYYLSRIKSVVFMEFTSAGVDAIGMVSSVGMLTPEEPPMIILATIQKSRFSRA